MNTREYIESGKLEAYALGVLSLQEQEQVQADVAQYPELAAELAAIELAMYQFAQKNAKQPPQGLQEQIWNTLQNNADVEEEEEVKQSNLLPLNPLMRHTRFSRAAVWAALVGSMALNAIFWFQNSVQHQNTLVMNSRIDSLQKNQQEMLQLAANYIKGKDMMADTSMQTIVMHTVVKGHPMAATLYWSKDKGEAYVRMDALPEPPKGMQYQLWVMQGGKPVDMGVLPLDMASTSAIQKMSKQVASGEAFAISLEKEGGSPTPTMENIYVMGKS